MIRSGTGSAVVPETSIFRAHNEITLAVETDLSEVAFGSDMWAAVGSGAFQIKAVGGAATGAAASSAFGLMAAVGARFEGSPGFGALLLEAAPFPDHSAETSAAEARSV
jgi:hypothetical protein